jgi:hypothetical protein
MLSAGACRRHSGPSPAARDHDVDAVAPSLLFLIFRFVFSILWAHNLTEASKQFRPLASFFLAVLLQRLLQVNKSII